MSQENENMSNNPEKGDHLVIGPKENTNAVAPDASEVEKNPETEENQSHTDNSTTSSLMANLSRRRYLNRNDELRTAQAMKNAATTTSKAAAATATCHAMLFFHCRKAYTAETMTTATKIT